MAESIVAASLAFVIISRTRRRRKIRKHKIWSRDWLKNRPKNGVYHQLMKELQLMDTSGYRNFLRMDSSTFEELLQKVAVKSTYKNTAMRDARGKTSCNSEIFGYRSV